MPAGKLRKNDTYPDGTIFRRVTDALETMTRRAIEVNRAAQRELVGQTTAAPVSAKRGVAAGVNGAAAEPAQAPAARTRGKRAPARKSKPRRKP